MQIYILLILSFVLAGCNYGTEKIRGYVDNPRTLLEDPLSVEYQQEKDALERLYLNQKITYAEYLQRKKELEIDYSRDVQKRRDIIEDVE